MKEDVAARLRREYEAEGLVEGQMEGDPFSQFNIWLSGVLAVELEESHTFVLATADSQGQPSARAVLMKGFSEEGIVFYTSLESRKSEELKANPSAAATFVWTPLHRQVRFEGKAVLVDAATADSYFATRPRGAQVAAHASDQSRVVTSRQELDTRFATVDAELGKGEIPRPDTWGGWRLVPHMVEFWQGQPDRFHDRVRYRLEEDEWLRERLAP